MAGDQAQVLVQAVAGIGFQPFGHARMVEAAHPAQHRLVGHIAQNGMLEYEFFGAGKSGGGALVDQLAPVEGLQAAVERSAALWRMVFMGKKIQRPFPEGTSNHRSAPEHFLLSIGQPCQARLQHPGQRGREVRLL